MASRFTKIDKLIAKWDPVLRRAFSTAVYQLRSTAQINKITERLQAGDIEGALRAVNLNPMAFRALDSSTRDAFISGADTTLAAFPPRYDANGYRIAVQFNMRNPAAENWLADNSARKVTSILDDQRVMIRDFLRTGMEQGRNPNNVALDLVGRVNKSTGRREGGMIGLTDSQANWVRNYRDELLSDNPRQALTRTLRDRRFDAAVIRAAKAGESIDPDLLETMVSSYRNRALQLRAETIARTEAMAALHESQQQAMEQAIDSGAISPDAVSFTWRTARDKRVRDSHAFMEGQVALIGQMFISGLGNQLEYPGDPTAPPEEVINCRCWREADVDFLAGVD